MRPDNPRQHGVLSGVLPPTTQELEKQVTTQMQQVAAVLTQLTLPTPAAAPAPVPAPVPAPPREHPEVRVGTPERYDGDPNTCGAFLMNCTLLFHLQPHTFASGDAKVAFAITHLTGRARLWGTAEWDRQTPACSLFRAFSEDFRKVFGVGDASSEAAQGLMSLRQGDRSVADFSIDFRTMARQSDWNSPALRDVFLQGLADYIKDGLVSHEIPPTLDELIGLANRVDSRVQARRRERKLSMGTLPPQSGFYSRQRLFFTGRSAGRGGGADAARPIQPHPAGTGASHAVQVVYVLWSAWTFRVPLSGKSQGSSVRRKVLVSHTSIKTFQEKRPLFHIKLFLPEGSHALSTFIDSGADASIMDEGLVQQLGIDRVPLPRPVAVHALDGHLLGTVTHQTAPIHMLLSGNHHETVQFHILSSPRIPVILGYPWLRRHNPHLDWATGAILGWNPSCHQVCLQGADVSRRTTATKSTPEVVGVPSVYHDFREVFSKARALALPPHRPYDCAINLLPGTSPPRGRLFSLSAPERGAMDTYINDSLAAGIIRPSSSPAGAGFFFVGKKDNTLRPCIDYRGLNDITIKNRYPLPLISSAFELLQGATIFTKLDLRNAYHLVKIREGDEWKTAFNTPSGHYEYLVIPREGGFLPVRGGVHPPLPPHLVSSPNVAPP
uniref:Retrotransposon-derived protein PEG10 n=1 Tax=Scophthalmus maximus TaxID=52904 RepID=A0A8D3E617_SCOMX